MERNYFNANTVVRKIDLYSNDTDKIMVKFVDVGEDGSPEVFPDSPNDNFIIMSIAEYALLKQQEAFSICDDTLKSTILVFVTIRRASDTPKYIFRKFQNNCPAVEHQLCKPNNEYILEEW